LRGDALARDPLLSQELAGDAAPHGDAMRAHWSIENSLHWVLDIAFAEDESRVHQGHADQNQAFLRRLGLDLLR
jgi:predicted transposase YbfD/YdcC